MKRPTRDDEAFTRVLRALAEAEARIDTPARVEAAVMARWDAAHASRGRTVTRRLFRTAGAMAAGVTLVGAVAIERELASGPLALPYPPPLADVADLPRVEAASEIDALQSPLVLERRMAPNVEPSRSALVLVGQPVAEGEIVHVVRMRVSRASLRVFGVAARPAAEMVDIDVVVGEDGVTRGVRVPL
jgi:hypothetical protein